MLHSLAVFGRGGAEIGTSLTRVANPRAPTNARTRWLRRPCESAGRLPDSRDSDPLGIFSTYSAKLIPATPTPIRPTDTHSSRAAAQRRGTPRSPTPVGMSIGRNVVGMSLAGYDAYAPRVPLPLCSTTPKAVFPRWRRDSPQRLHSIAGGPRWHFGAWGP